MHQSASDLKAFYNSKTGRIVRRILLSHIRKLWGDAREQNIAGLGFATPYLRLFTEPEQHNRVIGLAPAGQGGFHWPLQDKNKSCVCSDNALPLPTDSMDRVLVMHHLEFTTQRQETLREVWRVLKPRGRALFIVPNRNGFWARTEWSAFGNGTPFSLSQICKILHDSQFVTENIEEGLFMPPIRKAYILRLAAFLETLGSAVLPIAAGVHIVEVSKQLYAPVDRGSGSPVGAVRPLFAGPKPAMSSRSGGAG